MYGFGDDKLVSNDSVSVMEEILVEYIVDLVSLDFILSIWRLSQKLLLVPSCVVFLTAITCESEQQAAPYDRGSPARSGPTC